MAVADHKIEIPFLQKMVFHPTHDRSGVSIADLWNNDSNGEASLCTQRTREKIRTIFVFSDRSEDAVFGFLWNRVGNRRVIQDQRDGGGRQSQSFRQFLQAERLRPHAHLPLSAFSGSALRHAAESRTNRIQAASALGKPQVQFLLTYPGKQFFIHNDSGLLTRFSTAYSGPWETASCTCLHFLPSRFGGSIPQKTAVRPGPGRDGFRIWRSALC